MPYQSKAQRKFFHASAKSGENAITPATVKKWDAESRGKKLPERKGTKKMKSVADLRAKYKELP